LRSEATSENTARCLISTDDEHITYNKLVNRMATRQEHFNILKAIREGVSEELIAKVLTLMSPAFFGSVETFLKWDLQGTVEILKHRRNNPRCVFPI